VAVGVLARRGGREQVDAVEVGRERLERPVARELERREAVVLLRVVGDVLADALGAAAAQVQDGGLADETADVDGERLGRNALDANRQAAQDVPGGYVSQPFSTATSSASRRLRAPTLRMAALR
jgi:hypothetical protein